MPRAQPLPADERRAALIAATIPLVREHGLAVTTRQIATASGVAEGTIFRVFADKDELVRACIESACDPSDVLTELGRIDLDRPLRDRLVSAVAILQQRLLALIELMTTVRMTEPPGRFGRAPGRGANDRIYAEIERVIAPDRDRLRVSPAELAHLLRLVTFAGSHQLIADGDLLTPEQIVSTLLDGVLLPAAEPARVGGR